MHFALLLFPFILYAYLRRCFIFIHFLPSFVWVALLFSSHRIITHVDLWRLINGKIVQQVNHKRIFWLFELIFVEDFLHTQDLLSCQNILYFYLPCSSALSPRQSPGRWTQPQRKEILFSRNFLFISFKPFFLLQSWSHEVKLTVQNRT